MAVTNVKLMILAAVLSAILIQTSYALIECYECTGSDSSSCGSGANFKKESVTIRNCTTGACIKAIAKGAVIRGCSDASATGATCIGKSGGKLCTCTTALCNDSVTLRSALPVTIVLLALIAAVQMFYKK